MNSSIVGELLSASCFVGDLHVIRSSDHIGCNGAIDKACQESQQMNHHRRAHILKGLYR